MDLIEADPPSEQKVLCLFLTSFADQKVY